MVRSGLRVGFDGRRRRASFFCLGFGFGFGLRATMAVGECGPHLCKFSNAAGAM